MSKSWFSFTKRSRSTRIFNAKKLHREATFIERFDSVSVAITIAVLLTIIGLGWLVAVATDRWGWFDPQVIRPLPDSRILTNIRPANSEYIDAVSLNRNSGSVLIGKRNGEIINYDRDTGLIWHENIKTDGDLEGELGILSSGCGWTDNYNQVDCPHSDIAFANTVTGGVALRNPSGEWSTIISDSTWKGLDGELVQHKDVTHMAVSDDGNLVFVLAGEKGVAVFDQENKKWHPLSEVQKYLEAIKLGGIKVVPFGRELIIGSKMGLGTIRMPDQGVRMWWSNDESNEILDISRDRRDNIWVVVDGRCQDSSPIKCLWIGHVTSSNNIEYVIGEQEPHPNLFAIDLQHASVQGELVVTVGGAGIHSYNQKLRKWETILEGAVDSFIHIENGEILYAAQADKLVKVTDGKITESTLVDGGPFTQLTANESMILGLSQKGLIHDLGKNNIIAWRDSKISDDTNFKTGASDGSTVIMLGANGALVHHLTERRFSWIRRDQLPNSLRTPNLRLIHFSGNFWSVNSETGIFSKLSLSGNYPSIEISVDEQYSMPGPITSVSPTSDFIFALGSDKIPYKLDVNGNVSTKIGERLPENLNFKSIAASSNGLYFTDGKKIWHYHNSRRGWELIASSPENETIANIEANDQIHVLTNSGRVFSYDEALNNWQLIFGNGLNALFNSNSLSDARFSGNSLYLAGEGSVQRYNLNNLGFVNNWSSSSKSRPRLISINNNTPVWFVDNTVLYGENEILDREVVNAWEVADGYLAVSNSNSKSPYLIHFQLNGSQQCTFFGASPPSGKVIDSIILPSNDRILVMASDGASIYFPKEHRWIRVSGLPTQEDARLFVSNSHLIVSTPKRLRAIRFEEIPNLHSCDAPRTEIEFTVDIEGKFISVSEQNSSVVILNHDGEINIWNDGLISNVLPSHGEHPDISNFVRVVEIPNGFLFATYEKLWSYNLAKRTWNSYRLNLPYNSGRVISIDIMGDSNSVPVNVWTVSGSFHGEWRGQTIVEMTKLEMDEGLKIETDANQIIDVSQNKNRVAVSSEFEIELLDKLNRTGNYVIELPPNENLLPAIRTFRQNDNVHVVTNETENIFYLIPTPFPRLENRVKLSELAFRYEPKTDLSWGIEVNSNNLWRVARNGELFSCKIERGSNTNSCIKTISEPLAIDKSEIRYAYLTNNYQFLVTNSGWLRLNRELRDVKVVGAPIISNQNSVFNWNQTLLIKSNDGGLHVIPDNKLNSRKLSNEVFYARIDSNRLHIAHKGGVKIYDYGNGSPQIWRRFTNNMKNAAGLNWLEENSMLTYVNDKGFPGNLMNGKEIGPQLFDPQSIRNLVRESNGYYFWIQRSSGQIELIERNTCDISHHRVSKPCFRTVETINFKGIKELGRLYGAERNRLLFEKKLLIRTQNSGWVRMSATFSEFSNLRKYALNRSQVVSKIEEQGGRMVLAPVRIVSNSVRDTRNFEIAKVNFETELWEELNILNQLSWNRKKRKFEIPTINGNRIQLSSVEALVNGVPLPYLRGRQISPQSSLHPFYHLNPKGLWQVGDNFIYNVSLEDYVNPEGVVNGTFMFLDDKILDLNGNFQAGPKLNKISVGELEFVDNPRLKKVSSEIKYPTGEIENNFTNQGFKHDIRERVGWLNNSPVILGPLRIIPTDGMSGFDYVVGEKVEAVSDFNGGIHAEMNGYWMNKTAGSNWRPANYPRKRVMIGQIDGIDWELDSNLLNVSSSIYGNWRLQRSGLAFDVDSIFSALGTPQEIVITSKVGTHSIPKYSDIDKLSNPKSNLTPKFIETLETSPGNHIVYSQRNRKIWQSGNWIDVQGSSLPWDTKLAVDSSNFKITFERNKRPEILRRVSLINGSNLWKSISWRSKERLPTDFAQSLFVGSSVFSIGTKFGLKSHLSASSGQSNIFVFDSNPNASSILQIGQPENHPGYTFALDSNGSCAEIKTGGLGNCPNAVNLKKRRVFKNYLWHWVESDNEIEGHYTFQKLTKRPTALTSDGRWLHDSPISHVECDNTSYELWSDGKILHRINKALEIMQNDNFSGLHCQYNSHLLGNNGVLNTGTYLIGDNSAVQVDNTTKQITAVIIDEVRNRHSGDIFHHDNSFLIERGTRDSTYSIYWPDDIWRKLDWIEGLPAIDSSMAVQLGKNNDVTRITPVGLLDHKLVDNGLELLSNPIKIRTTSNLQEISSCQVERVERLDGIEHTSARHSDEALQWRCSNGKSMRDSPSTKGGLGNVKILEEDPFGTRVVVDQPDFWHWTKNDSTVGSKPYHEISYKGEQIGLSGGRFEMDQFKSIASPFNEIEIIGDNGWWQQQPEDLSLKGAKRTDVLPNPDEVESVSLDTDTVFDGYLLCMKMNGRALTLNEEGTLNSSEQCGNWTGNDKHWTYRNLPQAISTAAGRAVNNKQIDRQIYNGRFTDLTAVSSPVTIETSSGMEIAVPTGIGVGIWQTDRNLIRQYGYNDMNALIPGINNEPIVLWGNTSVSLFNNELQTCKSLVELGKMNVQKVEFIGDKIYHVLGVDNSDNRVLLTAECNSDREYLFAFRQMEISKRTRYKAHIANREDATGVFNFFARYNNLVLSNGGEIRVLDQYMETGEILALIVRHDGREALIITSEEVYLMDIDAAISVLTKLYENR